MSDAPFLSIITPTFNRAHLLGNCFSSLVQQTCLDFEWIIVDDGSTDYTQHILSCFQTDLFPILFLHKENGGKHTALNLALPHIRGRYVLILDSDDTLTEDAVSRIHREWSHYEADPTIGVIAFAKGTSLHAPNCTAPVERTAVDYFRCRRKNLRSCDCCEVIRADIMKRFPFPVFHGETFLSEGVLWTRTALSYQYVYINEVIYFCEYLEDGLTRSGRKLRVHNPVGGMYSSQLNMHPRNRLSVRLKNGLLYCSYGFFAGRSPGEILSDSQYTLLTAFCLFPGWLLFLYWRRKYG